MSLDKPSWPAVDFWPAYRKIPHKDGWNAWGWDDEADLGDRAAAEVATTGSPLKMPKRAGAPQGALRKPWVGRAPDAPDAHLAFG